MIALSYSRISNFDNCPLQFKKKFIDKTYPDDSDNPNFVRGNRIHKQLEEYTLFKTGKLDVAPSMGVEAQAASKIIDKVCTKYKVIYPEKKFAVDENFNQVDWFSKKTFYRVIYDFIALNDDEGLSLDWKTGKVYDYDKFGGQLHQSAAILFSLTDKIQSLTMAYMYVDHKIPVKINVHREEHIKLKQHIIDKSAEINDEKEFAPRKNSYCRFCLLTKADCQYASN